MDGIRLLAHSVFDFCRPGDLEGLDVESCIDAKLEFRWINDRRLGEELERRETSPTCLVPLLQALRAYP